MQIQNLSDADLLLETKKLVARERELLGEILEHLREVERRRLFSDLGYKSLFDYATKELGYAEESAYRRINAMRLLKDLPAIAPQIEDGSLSLSALSVAGTLFRAEAKMNSPLSEARKLEVLTAMTNKSRREAEVVARQMSSLSPQALKPEVLRRTEDGADLRIGISAALLEKIEKIKGLLAHSDPQLSTADLFEKLCDGFLAEHARKMTMKPKSAPGENAASVGRAIKINVRRKVWRRDRGQCQKCGSTHALQIDHKTPVGQGGHNDVTNLRLLCRPCNQREAIKLFGLQKMSDYLDRAR